MQRAGKHAKHLSFSLFSHLFYKIPPCRKEGCLVSGLPSSFVILAESHLRCLQMSTSWLCRAELVLHSPAVLGGEPQQAPHCHLEWEPEIDVSPSRSTNLCPLAMEDPQGPVQSQTREYLISKTQGAEASPPVLLYPTQHLADFGDDSNPSLSQSRGHPTQKKTRLFSFPEIFLSV